jgi:hypothetical protein
MKGKKSQARTREKGSQFSSAKIGCRTSSVGNPRRRAKSFVSRRSRNFLLGLIIGIVLS